MFPKDVKALAASAGAIGYETQILRAVDAVNDRQKTILFNKINHILRMIWRDQGDRDLGAVLSSRIPMTCEKPRVAC
jgi:hypothetical protein